jgi:hypothetical protein
MGSQSPSQCRLAVVPDFVAIPGMAKAAEAKYQVVDEGDLRDGPRRMGYFISGSSRLSGELGEYAVEGEQVFESPEKPFTTTDLVQAVPLNSDVAMVPQNAERAEDNRVSDRQLIRRNYNVVGIADNRIKCLTPAFVVDHTVTVFTLL